MKYIQKRHSRWRVVFPHNILQERYLGSFDTLEEAQCARDLFLKNVSGSPFIDGLTNLDDAVDVEHVWESAINGQKRAEKRAEKLANQRIVIPDPEKPFGIAYFSDLHIGDPGTDYKAIKSDAELVARTPRLWAEYHGDGVNNWIAGKLQALQRNDIVPHDAEIALFGDWLRMVGPSLLWVVAGNHDNWTVKLSGIDLPKSLLGSARVLYDRYEISFTLVWGENRLRYKVRHKWKYSSIFNVTHAIEVGWQRGGSDFDVGLGGHTHIGTVERPFFRHGRVKRAVLTGTYQVLSTPSDYGVELGMSAPVHSGSGAHVFDGADIIFCESLEKAVRLLECL